MRIKEIRLQRNISQKELAVTLGIAPNTLSQYENEKREPDIGTLELIADFFNVSVDCLLGREKEKPTPEDGDGLTEEQMEIVRLFESAPAALRTAALAVLRSAEGQGKVPDGASEAE